jgi:hypothetical protein
MMNKEFRVHRLNERGINRAKKVAEDFNILLNRLVDFMPECRELSIVKTKLEEACFFAKKGIANDPSNQEAEPTPL